MTWVRLDDGMPLHPKILSLSDGAFRLWINGLAFANRATTDGAIKSPIVPTLDHRRAWTKAQIDRFVDELKSAGLWVGSPDGHAIHGYAEYQEEALKARVEARKADARERKRRQREREKAAKNRSGHAVTPRDVTPGVTRDGARDGQRDTPCDTSRDRPRDVPRDAVRDEHVTLAADEAPSRPAMSQPPVPSRPVPSSTTNVVESATTPRLAYSADLASMAEGAYKAAIEAPGPDGLGGLYQESDKWRSAFVSVGRFAERYVERHGGDIRSTLNAWATRYVSERRSRRPDWWLEQITTWAGSGAESDPASDELSQLRAQLDALEPARNAAVIAGAAGVGELRKVEAKQDAIRRRIAAVKAAAKRGSAERRAS